MSRVDAASTSFEPLQLDDSDKLAELVNGNDHELDHERAPGLVHRATASTIQSRRGILRGNSDLRRSIRFGALSRATSRAPGAQASARSTPSYEINNLEEHEPGRGKYVFAMRMVVLLVLCGVCAALGTVAYIFLRNAEIAQFESQFYGSARLIADAVQSNINDKIYSGQEMATYYTSIANSTDGPRFPNVTLTGWYDVFAQNGALAKTRSAAWVPYLPNSTVRRQWEAYAAANAHLLEVPAGYSTQDYYTGKHGAWKVTDGCYARYANGSRYKNPVGRTPFPSAYPLAAWPVWQVYPSLTWTAVMYDLHSERHRALALDLLLAYRAPQMTSIVQFVGDDVKVVGVRPSTQVFVPVFADLGPNAAVVGAVGQVFTWDIALSETLPYNIKGLDCVLTCTSELPGVNSVYTMTISDGTVIVKGAGDLHQSQYDSYAFTAQASLGVNAASSSVSYTITLYPTDAFTQGYLSNTPIYAVIIVVGAVVLTALLFLVYDYLVQRRERKMRSYVVHTKQIAKEHFDRRKSLVASLERLPVHRAIQLGESDEAVLALIESESLINAEISGIDAGIDSGVHSGTASQTLTLRDSLGYSVMNVAISNNASNAVVSALAFKLLPIDLKTGVPADEASLGTYAWAALVQCDQYVDVVQAVLEEAGNYAWLLASAPDENGRPAIHIASHACQTAIKKSLYFMKRYEIKDFERPFHKSATCSVYLANDEKAAQFPTKSANALRPPPPPKSFSTMWSAAVLSQGRSSADDDLSTSSYDDMSLSSSLTYSGSRQHLNNTNLSSHYTNKAITESEDCKVAIKLMSCENHFQRELETRKKFRLSPEYVVGVIAAYTAQKHPAFAKEIKRRKLEDLGYQYCVVMPAADKSLTIINLTENFAGKDWVQIRSLMTQLATCVDHLHDNNVIHGDIKPGNIVRKGSQYVLIDLDASAEIGSGYSAVKYSSGYAPPELVYIDPITGLPGIKAYIEDPTDAAMQQPLKYEFVPAHPAHDVWALGVVFFELCTGIRLHLCDNNDNTNIDGLLETHHLTNDFKKKKLDCITNPLARNLLSQMLSKDPLKRPPIKNVLSHPFLTGRKAARMLEDPPEYDVFLSYRVASDSAHALALYDCFTAAGLRVFLDCKSLKPGVSWEEGFCDGLVKSRIFMPVLSRLAINHPTDARQSLSMLTVKSPVDNCLLEYHLALELADRGLVEKIYPIFLGDANYNQSPIASTANQSDYFADGCHPKFNNKVVVAAELAALEEHLDRLCLGSMIKLDVTTVEEILRAITAKQGNVVKGVMETCVLQAILNDTVVMLKEALPSLC